MGRKSQGEITLAVQELTSLVKSGEILKFTEKDLSNKLNMTEKTIRKHLTIIKGEIGSRDIKIISLRLVNILDEIMDDIEKYWRKAKVEDDEKKIMYYTKQIFFAIEKFTDFMERFGIKETIAQKVDLQADITTRSVSIQVIDDRTKVIQVEAEE